MNVGIHLAGRFIDLNEKGLLDSSQQEALYAVLRIVVFSSLKGGKESADAMLSLSTTASGVLE